MQGKERKGRRPATFLMLAIWLTLGTSLSASEWMTLAIWRHSSICWQLLGLLTHPILKLHNVNPLNVTPPLISPNPRERSGTDVLSVNLTTYCQLSLPYITGSDIEIYHQRVQTTCSLARITLSSLEVLSFLHC